ncbi:MAG: aquaporin family protein [Acidobacteria bacterium]|nr:aquaporin family protein [Acidobacteriota bacterium]
MLRRLVAELIATAFLLAAVVGSGIMAERSAGGNIAVALLANVLATGAALAALILTFAPISGAHMNPVVSLMSAINGELPWRDAAAYTIAQLIGAFAGVAAANSMFDLPLFFASEKQRTGAAQWLGEFIATFGLVGVIIAVSRRHRALPTALAVSAWITAACWFTSSTSFANPVVTLARSASDTFAGIRPADAPIFVLVQVAGGVAATFVFRWLVPVEEK